MTEAAHRVQFLLGLLESEREPNWEQLRVLADPEDLAKAWTLCLHTLLRRGTSTQGLNPARLIAQADLAARLGLLPLATPGNLRSALDRAAESLHACGAWQTDQPLFWEPLPAPDLGEQLWQRTLAQIAWPTPDRVRHAFAESGAGPCILMPEFLEGNLLDPIATRLEAALAAGHLQLEAEGVGKDARLSEKRSDRVAYLTGYEPALLQALPELAALIQALLQHLPECFAAAQSQPLHAPGRVMLARYQGPSVGYDQHVDNPAGPADNGRCLSFTLYLQERERPCNGGELAIWPTPEKPDHLVLQPCRGGQAVVFDARRVPHQVRPLAAGPARWALVLWLNAQRQRKPIAALPDLDPLDLLMPLSHVPLVPGNVLFHSLDESIRGKISLWTPKHQARVALVATLYRAHAFLQAFCAHHLALGVARILLIFDHLEEPSESQLAADLEREFAPRVLIWSGTETAQQRWPKLPIDARLDGLHALSGRGANLQAVCARQTLNASAALAAAQAGELGPLDWIVHLDADEFLHCGDHGASQLAQAFAAAATAGWPHLRLLNHELLRATTGPLRFKRNPRLAMARLGEQGWAATVRALRLEQDGARPWFTGYFNGKGAIAVAAGLVAAGVHGWYPQNEAWQRPRLLANPHILHFHNLDAAHFQRKYLAIAAAPPPPESPLFQASVVEERARACIALALSENASPTELAHRLEALHRQMTAFTDAELALLDELELLITPSLKNMPRLG